MHKHKPNNSRYKQGYFPIANSKKYTGPKPCIYRSSWEYAVMYWLENTESVITWSSEPFAIPYTDKKGKQRKYYVDFYVKMFNDSIWLLEVKPYAQTKKSHSASAINFCKWAAAKKYCDERNWRFSILTERSAIITNFLKHR